MITRPNTNKQRMKRHKRVRAKISGTPVCPRLNVFRSEANIYAQIIDDVNGVTLASASSLDKAIEGYGGNVTAASAVGKLIAVWPRALRTSCLTAAAISITAVCRLWLRAPVKAA
jgi:large subunit ribosomal protein L18